MKSVSRSLPALLICIVLPTLFFFSCTVQKDPVGTLGNIVETRYGRLQGAVNEDKTVTSFKGIPFAAPPVGNLRWREPQPPAAWEGIRDATHFSASCMQAGEGQARLPWTEEFMNQTEISEDCLFLNVWTPANSVSERLPVLAWIHGGGFREGSGSIDVYDGEELARKGIIVVTVNYRLGVLGFLSHPELTAESSHHASGNYGYMDQVAALRWIQENIVAFGGDPGRVTVSGQSAGALSVQALSVSPLAKGLFQRAILVSGARMSTMTRFVPRDLAEAKGVEFAQSKGVSDLAGLRALPAAELIADFRPNNDWSSIVDGWFLPEAMDTILTKGQHSDVPTMAGLTADDRRPRLSTLAEFHEQARTEYGDRTTGFLNLYPANSDEEAIQMASRATRDLGRIATAEWAEFRGNASQAPAYTYFFSRAIPWPEHPEFGAFHTSDVVYWFNNLKMLDRPWLEADWNLADTASSYWVNFARTGDPNGEGLPHWPAFDTNSTETLALDLQVGTIPIAAEKQLEFLSVESVKPSAGK
ncbi:MAG: carboxylesterase family protein [Acidobacteriota bacterium]|nr:MAG: carboxylesterase family protein [Acidobacteriota bacterium]